MKRSDAFPTKFLNKDDILSPTKGMIEKLVNESLGQGDDAEVKPVMYFASGIPKPMVINNTNWMAVEDLYGDESDNWPGKTIEVYVDPKVEFGGKRVGGLRLRAPATNGHTTTTKPAAPQQVWQTALAGMGAKEGHIMAALKTVKVSEWLKADPARTLEDAIGLVAQAVGDF